MKQSVEKYKWIVLGYILYISIVHLCLTEESHNDYRDGMVFYGITIPLITYFIYALLRYRKENGSWPLVKSILKQENVKKPHDNLHERKDIIKPNISGGAYPFLRFVELYGPQIEIATRIDNKTKKNFKTCDISDTKGNTISIRFDYSIGELTPEQIQSRKDTLWVVKTNGIFYLIEYKNPYLKK